MIFIYKQEELTVSFIDLIRNSYICQKADYPTRLLISEIGANILVEEVKKQLNISPSPPFHIFGMKIIRTSDLEFNQIELY